MVKGGAIGQIECMENMQALLQQNQSLYSAKAYG